jgi:fibronectin-binding autotransporter adhesin
MRTSVAAVVGLFVLGFGLLSVIPFAYATTTSLDQATCTGAIYPDLDASWDIPTSTCTLTSSYTILSGDTLEIPSGTTLAISTGGQISIDSGSTLAIDSGGTLTIGVAEGIYFVGGTITNSGTLTIENFIGELGISQNGSGGTIVNFGTLTIENSEPFSVGTYHIVITNTNSGTINIVNTGGTGIDDEYASITNSGTIDVENSGSGSVGIDNYASITNEPGGYIFDHGSIINQGGATVINNADATIIIECGGTFTQEPGSTFTNDGTYTVDSCNGVPEFPSLPGLSALGPLVLIALLLPALLIETRRFRARLS